MIQSFGNMESGVVCAYREASWDRTVRGRVPKRKEEEGATEDGSMRFREGSSAPRCLEPTAANPDRIHCAKYFSGYQTGWRDNRKFIFWPRVLLQNQFPDKFLTPSLKNYTKLHDWCAGVFQVKVCYMSSLRLTLSLSLISFNPIE